jgi:hypothetical protein
LNEVKTDYLELYYCWKSFYLEVECVDDDESDVVAAAKEGDDDSERDHALHEKESREGRDLNLGQDFDELLYHQGMKDTEGGVMLWSCFDEQEMMKLFQRKKSEIQTNEPEEAYDYEVDGDLDWVRRHWHSMHGSGSLVLPDVEDVLVALISGVNGFEGK